jgi:undecaprenyl-diphosphatase
VTALDDEGAEQVPLRTEGWQRHPADVARLVLGLAVFVSSYLITVYEPDAVKSVSADLVGLLRRLPNLLLVAFAGAAQLVALVLPFVVVGLLVARRQYRLLAVAAGAATIAACVTAALQDRLDRAAPTALLDAEAFVTGNDFPSGAFLAAATAVATVLIPVASRKWRRGIVVLVGSFAVLRVITAAVVPLHVVTQLGIGVAAGAALLVAFGAPARRLEAAEVAAAVAGSGIAAGSLHERLDAGHHSRMLETTTEGGTPLVLKVLGAAERDADLLQRAWRVLRFRGIDDERPGWAPEQVVRHEALASLLAAGAGGPVVPVLAATATQSGDGVLVLERVEGRRLDDGADISDDLLTEAWRALAALHTRRIAHRWFSPHHLLATDDGLVVLDFRWAQLGADDTLLGLDVANGLVGFAAVVGAERAVASARRVLTDAQLDAALPLLQPQLLSPDLRKELARKDPLPKEVKAALQAATGAEDVPLAELRRISPARVVSFVGAGFLLYVLLAFASNWGEISGALQEASWTRMPALLVLAFAGYPTGAMSLLGAVTQRLPFGQTNLIMLAQTFLNRFTPANAGGMALRIRYLQVHGSDLAQAATSVGLTSAGSGVVQVVMLVGFALWAGSSDSIGGFELPSASTIGLVLLVVACIGGVVYLTPWGRRVIFGKLITTVGDVYRQLSTLARSPSKLALLLGGAFLGKLATIIAFVLSCRMLGITDLSFPALGLLYMTANTVASAAPTPGGLGALEAALVVALQGRGVPPDQALAAVLVFRLATYWLPVLPSWLALRHVRKEGIV